MGKIKSSGEVGCMKILTLEWFFYKSNLLFHSLKCFPLNSLKWLPVIPRKNPNSLTLPTWSNSIFPHQCLSYPMLCLHLLQPLTCLTHQPSSVSPNWIVSLFLFVIERPSNSTFLPHLLALSSQGMFILQSQFKHRFFGEGFHFSLVCVRFPCYNY